MDGTYRLLGKAHEDDLAREAESRRLAAIARTARAAPPSIRPARRRKRWLSLVPRLATLRR
jgi:hypothetical protein